MLPPLFNPVILFAVALGGAVGAILRFWVSGILARLVPAYPIGTFSVNVIGSFLLGWLSMLLVERFELALPWRLGILVGMLGAFTTFSTFSLETFRLAEAGRWWVAGLNVILNVSLCLVAVGGGLALGRRFV